MRGMKVVVCTLLIAAACVMAWSGWQLWQAMRDYRQGDALYESVADAAVLLRTNDLSTEKEPSSAHKKKEEIQPDKPDELPSQLLVDFGVLHAINEEVCAWIFSEDGQIDYPIVRGEDNKYYLNHLIDGTRKFHGTLFMDCRNDAAFGDQNTFIYGHNMRNGSMFGELEHMGAAQFTLVTPTEIYRLSGFSGYVTSGYTESFQMQFADGEEFLQYVDKVRAQSEFDADVELNEDDRIITLATCIYDYDNARYVLHCKCELIGYNREAPAQGTPTKQTE